MQAPPIGEGQRYPVTSIVAVSAIAATFAFWQKADISALVMSHQFWPWEPWRLLTSCLLHVNGFHILFNLYGLWIFGTFVERTIGSFRYVLLLVVLGASSSAAEYAFYSGGIGLSGIGYGLFGYLWVCSKRDYRYRESIDQQTILLFIVWFFACIVTTVLNVFAVGNVAHGAGAIAGAAIGYVNTLRPRRPALTVIVSLAISALTLAAAGPMRPYLNLSHNAGEYGVSAYEALRENRNAEAEKLLRSALQIDGTDASAWYNLGVVYNRLGKTADAGRAFEQAFKFNPHNDLYQNGLMQWKWQQSSQAETAGKFDEAVALYKQTLEIAPGQANLWAHLSYCYRALGRKAEADDALTQARKLDPSLKIEPSEKKD